MPLVFIVDKDIPKSVNTITLSYTLFDITESAKDLTVAQLD
jgi:cytochrome c oxidase assembly protein subunit 11